jgi:hypothetical protein
MRMITLMGTAAAALTAATLLAAPASADRVCRQTCDDGFCRTRCFDHGDRLYMYDRDRETITTIATGRALASTDQASALTSAAKVERLR